MSYAPQSNSALAEDPTRLQWGRAVFVVAIFVIVLMILILTVQPAQSVAEPLTFDESLPSEVVVRENSPLEVDVSTEPAADTIDIQNVEGPATVVLNRTLLRIEPEPEAEGTVRVDIRACVDGDCVDRSITAEVIAENDPPLPGDDEAIAAANVATLLIPVLENDTDEEGHELAIVSAEVERGEGVVSVSPDNRELLFTPRPGVAGDWVLSYVVSDGEGGLAEGTVTIFDGDAAPEPRADEVTLLAGQNLEIEVLANDVDDGGVSALRVSDVWIEQAGGFSALEVSTVDDRRIQIVAGPEPGVVDVMYVAEDERGRSTLGVLTVTIETLAPTAIDDELTVVAGSSAVVDVLANDLPRDGLDPTTLTLVSSSSRSVGINLADFTIVYEPSASENEDVDVTYEICNGAGQCDTATLRLTVESAQPTVAGQGSIQLSGEVGVQVVPWQIVSGGDANFPANATTAISTQGVELFSVPPSIGVDGSLTLAPAAGASGAAVIAVDVDDRRYQITVSVTP